MYLDDFGLYISSLVILSLLKQVTKEIKVFGIIEKVYSMIRDEICVSTTNFMEESFMEHFHDERKLWWTSDSNWRLNKWFWIDIWFQRKINKFFKLAKYVINASSSWINRVWTCLFPHYDHLRSLEHLEASWQNDFEQNPTSKKRYFITFLKKNSLIKFYLMQSWICL